MAEQGEKSQEPTPYRRQQAREKGQVARSQDLSSALVLLGGLMILMMMGPAVIEFLGDFTRVHLGGELALSSEPSQVQQLWNRTIDALSKVLLPVLAFMLLVTITSNLLQVGFMFVPEQLMPDLSRLNPLKGLQRLFSLPSLMRFLFGLFKVIVIASVAIWSLYFDVETILGLSALSVSEIADYVLQMILLTAFKIAGALLILALLDFAFQKWKHEQDLMMTHQEVREEMRNLQGDPQIIARRRQTQRQLAMSRLSSAVPEADVVVTNPTELAVAIRYDPETMKAPIVAAKGAGVLAQRIRKLALENDVPVVERKPLAQALYRDVGIGEPVPTELYRGVAEVLAYVYQLKGKKPPAPPRAA